jgi:hypothetical protein
MVLQSFEVLPRKVNDLGSGIAAGALLLGQGIAGLLTSRPTRLALQSNDGSGGAIIDISVEAVQTFALLSKDTAVLLADGGVLWALLDLQSSVKLKAIARDVRVLYARAGGESAFAIGDDGKGIALTLGRNDVGVRSFAIRGTLQACDVGEQVTYAIVEADGGRQLHVHPGVTPELGTSVRATLPEGALGLDRVRGSQQLSAVFKRGDERVCVVHGAQKLEAKLVRLDAKPADVAVLDGNLLVAFVDGRLALYNREAIDNAGDTALVATTSLALNAQGRPRVLLAGVSKGTAVIWIGTTAGEVFLAGSTVNQGDVVSQRPAASAPSRPDYAAQLAAHAAEIEALRAESERQKAAHATEVEELRAEGERQKAAHATEVEGRESARAHALEEQGIAHRAASDERAATYRKALEEQDAGHLKAMADAEAAYRKAIEDADEVHLKAIAEMQEQKTAAGAQLVARTAERDACTAELDERTRERDARTAELDERTKERDARTAELAERTAELAERTAELAACRVERDGLHGELEAARGKLAAAEEQLVTRTAELEARTQERDALLQAELEAARGKLAAAQEQLTSRARDLDARNKAYEEMRAEGSRLMADLATERERIEKIFPFGSDGLRSVERAREKLDGVLSQIQGILFKRPHD